MISVKFRTRKCFIWQNAPLHFSEILPEPQRRCFSYFHLSPRCFHRRARPAICRIAAAVAAAVGLLGQFLDEGVFLLLIGFFRLIRNALIPAIFSQGLPHGSHDLRKLRVTLVLGGR